jgi:glucose/arabinose dehydrogenase
VAHLSPSPNRRSTSRVRVGLALLVVSSFVLAACGEGSSNQVASNGKEDRIAPSAGKDAAKTAPPRATVPAEGITLRDTGLAVATAADGLNQPTSVAFAGSRMLVTEKATGKVRLIDKPGTATDVLDLAVNSFDERGLLGITVHPDFPDKPFVYLHWTWRGAGDGPDQLLGADSDQAGDVPALGNRVDRFRWSANKLTFDRNIVQFPSNTLNTDTSGRVRGNHDSGPLAFGPDNKLYVQLGDQNMRNQLQNIAAGPPPDNAHFTGVILRLNDDGSVPSDNPFRALGASTAGEAGKNVQKVYAYGVRNSFGLAFEPGSGALWQTENGDDASDEINVFRAGSNSGWIQLQGAPKAFEEWKRLELESKDGFDNPTYPPSNLAADAAAAQKAMVSLKGSHYSPPVLTYVYPPALTAIGFVPGDELGARSKHTAWVGTVLTNALLRYPLAPNGKALALKGGLADGIDNNTKKGDLGESDPYVVGTGFGIITDIDQGPDGAVYVSSIDGGKVYRLAKASGTGGTKAAGGAKASTTVPAAKVTVAIKDDLFEPAKVEVAKGEAVMWKWEGSNPHNVDGPGFKSKIQTSGTFTKVFDKPGTFDYRCDVHPTMKASVTVTG